MKITSVKPSQSGFLFHFLKRAAKTKPALLKIPATILPCLVAMAVIAGCASTKVTDREQVVKGKLPRPAHIWVYDFAATADDVPIHSALAGNVSKHSTPQTAAHIAEGRKLGAEVEKELVALIRGMGLTTEHAVKGTKPQVNDLVIEGYIISFDEGSAVERVTIGLGVGSSELKVAVEGFQMTAKGLRKLGSGTTESGSGKTPGAAVGAAVLLATKNPVGLIVAPA